MPKLPLFVHHSSQKKILHRGSVPGPTISDVNTADITVCTVMSLHYALEENNRKKLCTLLICAKFLLQSMGIST